MEKYSVDIKWIDPNGNGLLTTKIFAGFNIVNKAIKTHEKRVKHIWGCNASEIKILKVTSGLLKSGFFRERQCKNI